MVESEGLTLSASSPPAAARKSYLRQRQLYQMGLLSNEVPGSEAVHQGVPAGNADPISDTCLLMRSAFLIPPTRDGVPQQALRIGLLSKSARSRHPC